MPFLREVRDEVTSETHLRDISEDLDRTIYDEIALFGMRQKRTLRARRDVFNDHRIPNYLRN